MKKLLLTAMLAVAFVVQAAAQQTATVTAVIVDAATAEGVPGAVIELTPLKNPDKKKYTTSDASGKVTAAGLPYGKYSVKVTFIGYDDAVKEVGIWQPRVSMGKIEMHEGSTRIEAVRVEAQSMRTSQKGDTVSYNASAFKVSDDADVEGLLKKMPGITINNGEVEAQGETVKKVFVDGKEFFGEDVTSAIKSLPAQAVKSIEVYNKLSDQAEFSGMDDGEGYKAINIVTHTNMRQGQFGKLYAGYGYDADTETGDMHKYLAGGNVNIFNGDSRLSIIGLFNNINQQNFSFEDILGVSGNTGGGRPRGVGQYMVRPQSGVATVNSIGLNFSDTWGKRDNVTFQGSYFFNRTSTENHSTIDKWYEDPYPVDTLSTAGNSRTINSNHRLNARIEWKISPNQSLMSRTGFSYQANDPLSRTFGRQWGQSGYSIIDNYSGGDRAGFYLREFLQYRAKLGKDGRTITVDGNINYSDNDNTSDSWSNRAPAAEYDCLVPADTVGLRPLELLYQRTLAPKTEYELRGNVTYTEPISKHSQFSMQYRATYEYKESDKRVYTGDSGFSALGGTPDPLLSNAYTSGYMKHRVGPGFRYSKDRNTFIANVYYQRSSLDGKVDGQSDRIRHDYNNVTYFMMGNLNINRENTIRLFVMSNTSSPGVTDLQGIYDLSDAQYISRGNPNLSPSYSHNVRFHYVNSNVNKGRTFMWMFTLQNTSDYVTTHTLLNPEMTIDGQTYRPLQYSQRINMDGYWSLRTHISYGMPLSFMKCNLNMMTGVNYTVIPTMFGGTFDSASGTIAGGERNDASSFSYDANVVLGSNISENIDFTVGWNGSYSLASNSLASKSGRNRYFDHSVTASLKATFLGGFTFTGSFAYTQNVGFTNDYNNEYMLCNLYLGHKLFRNRRGEIQVGVNDLLNQNKAFVRTTGSGYTQNATNSVVGRYYTVQFVYNLRHFGKKGSKNLGDYGVREGGSRGGFGGMRPMGPPPGR